MSIKMIIDTDPGIDDAMAIFFAQLHAEIDLIAMTSIFGNVTVKTATRNALVLSERGGLSIPVVQGTACPLIQPPNPVSDYVHGKEGFGDMPAQIPISDAIDIPAAEFICKLIRDNPGEIVLCPIGPLTNIALALCHDPGIVDQVKSVIIMGGSLHAKGNVTAYAEANVWNDPHAADAVFAARWPLTMVGLDVTQQVICTLSDFEYLARCVPVLGGFLHNAVKFYIHFYGNVSGVNGCHMHDPCAIIAAVMPNLFTYQQQSIKVAKVGKRIGETYADKQGKRSTVNIATEVQVDAVKKLFFETLKSGF